MKKILSVALTGMLLIVCCAGMGVTADEGYTAKLSFANSDWSVQEWGNNASTTVCGAGNYTIRFNGAASGARLLVIDIVGACEALASENLGLIGLTILADGVEIPVDLSKIATGDLEENGNFRIELVNEFGPTKAEAPVDPDAVRFSDNLTICFIIGILQEDSPADDDSDNNMDIDPTEPESDDMTAPSASSKPTVPAEPSTAEKTKEDDSIVVLVIVAAVLMTAAAVAVALLIKRQKA